MAKKSGLLNLIESNSISLNYFMTIMTFISLQLSYGGIAT